MGNYNALVNLVDDISEFSDIISVNDGFSSLFTNRGTYWQDKIFINSDITMGNFDHRHIWDTNKYPHALEDYRTDFYTGAYITPDKSAA